jgi:undecaprenyl-diphosphatase
VRGQALVAALCAGLTAWLSVRFLMKYFESERLTPFGVFCIVWGVFCSLYFLF